MRPFKAIVRKSTVGELVLRLSNGHIVVASPQPELHFGQEVMVCYDKTRDRVSEIRTEFIEEDLLDEPEVSEKEVPWEDVDDTLDLGFVN